MFNISLNQQTTQLTEEASELLAKTLIRNDNIRTGVSIGLTVAIAIGNVAATYLFAKAASEGTKEADDSAAEEKEDNATEVEA